MKKKIPKIIIDCLMLATLITALATMRGNLLAHTVFGFCFAGLMIVHTVINFKWIIGISKNFKRVKPEVKTQYIVNILLTLVWLAVIVTAVLAMVDSYAGIDFDAVRRPHGILGAVGLALTIAHMVLYRKRIAAWFKGRGKKRIKKADVFAEEERKQEEEILPPS